MEILPTGLPELSKPSRTTLNLRMTKLLESCCVLISHVLFNDYAHIEVVVTLVIVNFFGFLVIARDHGGYEGRH